MNVLPKNWQKKFYKIALASLVGAGIVAAYLWEPKAAIYAVLSSAVLLTGFKITELLIAVLTGVRKANTTAIALLFMAKLAWWVSLFVLSKNIPAEMRGAVGIGFGSFLCAASSMALFSFGLPSISAEKE